MIVCKDELESQLKDEKKLILEGVLKDDSPLDVSVEFEKLCNACRIGDAKGCQEAIATGVNLNASDKFDYTPLILASLCGHYEVVRLLLESGALCERDTFQGERCLYNALNNRIRDLLLKYDYSKSTDPLQPLASHITSLLTRQTPQTSDLSLRAACETWHLHKIILCARSPYFQRKLSAAPETTLLKLASSIPQEAFQLVIKFIYMGNVNSDIGLSARDDVSDADVLKGIDKSCKQLEIGSLWQQILAGSDRRIARQKHQDEVARGRDQLQAWYQNNVIRNKFETTTDKLLEVKWTRRNLVFADILLRADVSVHEEDGECTTPDDEHSRGKAAAVYEQSHTAPARSRSCSPGLPHISKDISKDSATSPSSLSTHRQPPKSVLYPVHRAMLLRSDYFHTMFTSDFQEAKIAPYLHIITVDCSPAVLEIILDFIYTEKVDIPLELAVDVIFAADMLLLEKLKTKAATVISTLGNGTGRLGDRTHSIAGEQEEYEAINIYDVLRTGWIARVQRLEEFSARYIAYRLEDYIDDTEFEELIRESASRITKREATDTIELIDDIRYYLSDRFRLRFEDSGFAEMIAEDGQLSAESVPALSNVSETPPASNSFGKEDVPDSAEPLSGGAIRTLDGKLAADEFAADAINYRVLLGKIDALLDRLKLDA